MLQYFALSAPLYALVLLGYVLGRWSRWRSTWTDWASKFLFAVALPALLFHVLSDLAALPSVDARLLLAFFGGCFIVFALGRVVAARYFGLEPVAQSTFALGGVFSNNVMLGLPLAKLTLGPRAIPAVALVIAFNALILWSLASISVEWSRHGALNLSGLAKTLRGVVTNPLIIAILAGTAFGLTGWQLPHPVEIALAKLAQFAAPLALLVLGLGLVRYGFERAWPLCLSICALKLLAMPLVVWSLAALLGLPALETHVIVLLASMAVGANVYLMAIQFQTLQGAIANSLVVSTALAALTTPLLLSILDAFGPALSGAP